MVAILSIAWLLLCALVITLRYYQDLLVYWNESVIKYPVLIFESDDWGAGPLEQAQSLARLEKLLSQYADMRGHHPIMTLGAVLSIPHANKIKESAYETYYAKSLNHADFFSIKTAMINGKKQRVFDIQLHAMAHYWPGNLMHELRTSKEVRQWMEQEEFPRTELLPSVLQSRWVNTEILPTAALNNDEINKAAKEEVAVFKAVFGFIPKVVVPPTFVWNNVVERCWQQQKIKYIVTPGQCYDHRGSEGKPVGNGKKIINGQLSSEGLTYIVRNDYFEPSLGHTAKMAIKVLETKTKLAQPTLLEMHRFNYIQDNETTENSLTELDKVISSALDKFPNVLFLSTEELASKYLSQDSDFIERSYLVRLSICMQRIWMNDTIRKWLYLSGLFVPVLCLKKLRKQ